MDEFDCIKECLPLANNLPKYLCVKTKINHFNDFDFNMNNNLEKTIQKFTHTGWREMRPLVVGIKCYLNDTSNEGEGYVDVMHSDKNKENTSVLESLTVRSEVWYQFKYPLLDAYHTRTWISMSQNMNAFTLAILNTPAYVRDKHSTNYFPAGYKSYDSPYSELNKAVIYVDNEGTYTNAAKSENGFIINSIDKSV